MSTLWSKLENNPTLKNVYVLLRMAGLSLAKWMDRFPRGVSEGWDEGFVGQGDCSGSKVS
jgi:hypothetical protein